MATTIIDILREVVEKEYSTGVPHVTYSDSKPVGCYYPNDYLYNQTRIMELLLSNRVEYIDNDLKAQLTRCYEHENHITKNPRYIPTEGDYAALEWLKNVRDVVGQLCYQKDAAVKTQAAAIMNEARLNGTEPVNLPQCGQ